MANEEPLTYKVSGGIFQVDRAVFTRSAAPPPDAQLTLLVRNRSGEWVDVNIDRSLGVAKTGHINNNEDGGFSEVLKLYEGPDGNKITRWRPGFGGIAGNGGGEIWFWLPQKPDRVEIELTVRG